MDAEQIIEEACNRLHEQDVYAVLTIVDANIDQDDDTCDVFGNVLIKGQPDGKWDPNPEHYAGDEPGRHVLRVYAVDEDGHYLTNPDGSPAASVFTIDEVEVLDSDWTVEEIVEDALRALQD